MSLSQTRNRYKGLPVRVNFDGGEDHWYSERSDDWSCGVEDEERDMTVLEFRQPVFQVTDCSRGLKQVARDYCETEAANDEQMQDGMHD